MNRQQIIEQIRKKGTFLCVGLDTDIKKIPEHLLTEEDPMFAFNKAIIDATAPYCVAYKPIPLSMKAVAQKAGRPWNAPSTTCAPIIRTTSSSPTPSAVTSATPPRSMPAHFSRTWV